MKAHGATARFGRPVLFASNRVAGILAQMKLDTASIVTACCTTRSKHHRYPRRYRAVFGSDSSLVDGVTKLSRIELQSDQTSRPRIPQARLGHVRDIRVLLVKLATACTTCRPCRSSRATNGAADRRETMDIYVPCGTPRMHRMKTS